MAVRSSDAAGGPRPPRMPLKELPFAPQEFANRLAATREAMAKQGLDLLLLAEPEDIYYLTAYQTVGAPAVQALMVPGRVDEDMYFVTRLLELSNAEYRSVLHEYVAYKDTEDSIAKVCDEIRTRSPSCKTIGFQDESKRLSYAQVQRMRKLLEGCTFVDCSSLVKDFRVIKSPAEQAVMAHAAAFCAFGQSAAIEGSRPGMSETQISALVYKAMMDAGCEWPAYPPFVCAGRNSCMGHYTGAQDVLKEGETLFLEIGGCYRRYHAAMMRTCYVGNDLPPALAEAGHAVAKAVEVAMAAMVPGAKCGDVDASTREILSRPEKGWVNSLRTGYSIGLGFYTDWADHESFRIEPGSETVLQAGMVFHLIPWIQIPSTGHSVGLSDTVVVGPASGAVSIFPSGCCPAREIALIKPSLPHQLPYKTSPFGPETARRVRGFFAAEPTPLVPLRGVATSLGLEAIYIKDESKRLGQQAFKVFGGAYAMASWLAQKLGVDLGDVGGLAGLKTRYESSPMGAEPTTFVTCTDGNHGRAVAWAAKQLGQKAVVYMPKGSSSARVNHVRAHGGECTVTDLNYDETVELAFKRGAEHGWVVLQDTATAEYQEIPTWIMQGYTAMADEAVEQILALDGQDAYPTHVFLQVGVGSMAGAVLGYFAEREAESESPSRSRPVALVLEPKRAACAFASAEQRNGQPAAVDGDLDTMIAGLACGVPSELAWPILARYVDGGFCWMEDWLAGNGMRLLAKNDVEAGECGGAGIGLVQRIMDPACPKAASARSQLGLCQSSRVLIFNTEGATDPENYALQLKLEDVPPCLGDFGFAAPLPGASARAPRPSHTGA